MDSNEVIVYHNSFVYDKPEFKPYLRLHMRPHDRYTGWRCMGCFGSIAIIFGSLLCAMAIADPSVWFAHGPDKLILIGGAACVCCMFAAIYGVYRFRSTEPRRSEAWWDLWATVSLENLASRYYREQLCPAGVETWSLIFFLILGQLCATIDEGSLGRYSSVTHRKPWDRCTPFKTKSPSDKVDPVQFDSFFLEDKVLKGASRKVFAKTYADIHDIVEHPQVPGWALVRNVKADEIFIKTDAFDNNVSWDEVKSFIKQRRKEEISPFVSRKKKKRKSQ